MAMTKLKKKKKKKKRPHHKNVLCRYDNFSKPHLTSPMPVQIAVDALNL